MLPSSKSNAAAHANGIDCTAGSYSAAQAGACSSKTFPPRVGWTASRSASILTARHGMTETGVWLLPLWAPRLPPRHVEFVWLRSVHKYDEIPASPLR